MVTSRARKNSSFFLSFRYGIRVGNRNFQVSGQALGQADSSGGNSQRKYFLKLYFAEPWSQGENYYNGRKKKRICGRFNFFML